MAWLVIAGLVGLVLGWIARGRTSPTRRDLVEYDERAQRAERRLRSVVTERDNEHTSVLTLRAALRSERQLLDGVADQAGVDPEAFRKTISKEYLGRELVVSPASLVDFDFGTNAAAEAEVAALQRLLRAKDTQLSEAREQIHRIRADVESLAMAGGGPQSSRQQPMNPAGRDMADDAAVTSARRSTEVDDRRGAATLDVRTDPAVIDLCDHGTADPPNELAEVRSGTGGSEIDRRSNASQATDRMRFLEARAESARLLEEEVASLRARLADTAVANDDIRTRIDYRRSLDAQLADIVAQLETFRERVSAEKPPAAPDEDADPVL